MTKNIPEQVIMESRPCPMGCRSDDDVVFKGRDRLHSLPGEFAVVRCKKCGLMRTNPRPSPDTIGFYYPDDYGPYQNTKVGSGDELRDKRSVLKRWVRGLFQFNCNRVPSLAPGKMLEIGCASGEFMHEMNSKGWDVAGVEFSPAAAENARKLGYQVYTGAVEAMPDPIDLYDMVVGWMVIEHLHDPVSALKKLNRCVRSDGYLVISVPNAGSMEARWFRSAWYANHLPNHLYHFSPRTLGSILQESGWKTEKIYHQRILSSLVASIGLALLDKGVATSFAQKLTAMPSRGNKWNYALFPLAYILSLFGQTGRMTIWAKKI